MFLLILKTIILGLVEGITEWLPVSSTGHLILVGHFLDLGISREFTAMFDVVIQLGAILAVVLIYFPKLWPFHAASGGAADRGEEMALSSDGSGRKRDIAGAFDLAAGTYVDRDKLMLWMKILVSVIPAIVIGLPLDDWLDAHLYKPLPVALMLILYGILFILIENYNKRRQAGIRKLSQISFPVAVLIGLFQCLALIPGTSRSGATIIGGILVGMSRPLAAEYTFFLAIPTMAGAALLKLVKYGLHFGPAELLVLFLGMLVSFVVSLAVIRFLMKYIRKHDFKPFGWYRIVLGVLVLILGLMGFL